MSSSQPYHDDFEILYRDYYQNFESYSDETSSYWKRYGETQRVKKSGDEYKLSGEGFGDFSKKNIIRS